MGGGAEAASGERPSCLNSPDSSTSLKLRILSVKAFFKVFVFLANKVINNRLYCESK